MQASDEIKAKLDIVDVIKDYLQLQMAGSNFRSRCPFHQENSASFMVSPEKQIWHCFGCGRGGDMFAFLMEIESIGFVDALRILGPRAGVEIKKLDPKASSERARLMDIVGLSRKFYHRTLMESGMAKAAMKYLEDRGLTEETIEEWQIGFSPDSWDMLSNLLKENNFKEEDILKAGMNAKSNSSNKYFDRFRDRVMFPINDVNCNTVGFSARVSPEKEATETMGKYVNSPQTPIYDKSRILFGLDKAKMEIKNQDLAIIVEGQMDVISAHQAGFKNVVASSGTALTGDQIILLKRFSPNIALAFDMDKAGEKAADRGIQEAMAAEMNIKVIELAEGMDPDDCIKKDPGLWVDAVMRAKPMMEYYFDKHFKDIDVNNIEDKRKVSALLLPTIGKLGNKIEQDYWLRELSQRLDIGEHLIREALSNMTNTQPRARAQSASVSASVEQEKPKGRAERLSDTLLGFVLKFPEYIPLSMERLSVEFLGENSAQAIYKKLIFFYNKINSENNGPQKVLVSYSDFRPWFEKEIGEQTDNNCDQLKTLDKLVLLADKDYDGLDQAKTGGEFETIISSIKKEYLNYRMKELGKMISEAERDNDQDKIIALMKEFQTLSEESRSLGA